jgi:arylsulfatase A-like enzyme
MNVLHVMSDQLHARCLGFAAHPQAITPNLDRLAAESVCFDRCYAQSPICTPSRTSMLSGQYSHNTGYFALNGPRPEHLPSYMSHFKAQGYRTAGIGKLHTPDHPRNWLEDHLDLFGDTYFTVDNQPIMTRTDWIRDLKEKGLLETDEFQLVIQKKMDLLGF